MGIYIPSMEMPKDCPMCPLSHWNAAGNFTGCEITKRYFSEDLMTTNTPPSFCPLISVPDHGRLIDADALKSVVADERHMDAKIYQGKFMWSDHLCVGADYEDVCKAIDETPTIIPADEVRERDGTLTEPYEECGDWRPQTNADRIRAMTCEELADRIMAYIRCEACEREFHIECNPLMTCRGVWLDWLKEEAE